VLPDGTSYQSFNPGWFCEKQPNQDNVKKNSSNRCFIIIF